QKTNQDIEILIMSLTHNLADDRRENRFRRWSRSPLAVGHEQFQHTTGTIDNGCQRRIGDVAVLRVTHQNLRDRLGCGRIFALAERQGELELNDRGSITCQRDSLLADGRRLVEHWLGKPQAVTTNLRILISERTEDIGFAELAQAIDRVQHVDPPLWAL